MDPDRLREIDALFAAALEHPTSTRDAFLAAACPDATLRHDVDALLAAHPAAASYFDDLVDQVSAASSAELDAALHQRLSIGPYRTLRVLGYGGMGTVFLAERADGQFEQQVALKLVRLGMEHESVIRRFLAERQIVARLTHPNIARLLDGGITSDGRPFFVMEYVAGRPITDHSDAERLTIDARVRLVLAAAEAVDYAHRCLVVHRDVKPSNILVSVDSAAGTSAQGRVKLLDFGIAKLLDPEQGHEAGITGASEHPFTLAYASPEQIRGEPVTTATDVYSLGVVLYELLTGRLPHGPADLPRRELERLILEQDIVRPSDAIGGNVVIADLRRTRPDKLRRRLQGDLDTICLTALRREPERRYRSVDQLIQDLRRHLAGLPVAARGDTFGYRATMFVRRHRIGVTLAASLALVIVTAAIALAVQSVRLARERDKAQQVAALFVDLFAVADPSETRGAAVTAREVLERAVDKVEEQLRNQPDVQASLLDVLGRVHQNLGLYERAAPLLDQVVTLRRQMYGAAHPEVASALLAFGEAERHRGQYDAAERVLRDALALNRRLHGEDAPTVAKSLNELGKVLYAKSQFGEAEPALRQALMINRKRLGGDHVEVAETANNLAAVVAATGDYASAETLFREALQIRRRQLGDDHPSVPAVLSNFASVLGRKGDYVAAEQVTRDALAIYRRVFGDEHPTVATTLNNLGLVLFSRADLAGAEGLLREALSIRRRRLPAAHPDVAQTLANLGLVRQTQGDAGEADTLYAEALEIRRAAYGPQHPLVAQTLNNIGLLRQQAGRLSDAAALLRDALEILRARLGPSHPLVATNLHNLGALHMARRATADAESAYREALTIRRAALPPAHPEIAVTLLALGRLLDQQGRAADAASLLREAVAIREKTLPAGDRDLADAQTALAACLARLAPPMSSRH